MRKLSLVLLLALLPALFPRWATAQDDSVPAPATQSEAEREARAHYARGQAAFNAERYDQAVTEFEAGFAALPRPGFLLNIGHAERKRGNLRKARAAYKKYLLVEPTTKLRDDVMALLADLDSALADEDRAAKAEAEAAIAPPPQAPPPPVVTEPPPPVPAPATAPVAAPILSVSTTPTEPPLYRRHWVWAVAGAVLLGTATAIYLSQRSSADDNFHSTGSLGTLHP